MVTNQPTCDQKPDWADPCDVPAEQGSEHNLNKRRRTSTKWTIFVETITTKIERIFFLTMETKNNHYTKMRVDHVKIYI